MSIDIGRGLITKILETKDFAFVKDMQIKPSFLYGEDKKAYMFIHDYFLQNGEVPTVRVFKKENPDYELETRYDAETEDEVIGTDEPLRYWCDEVRKRTKHNKLANNVENIITKLENFETDNAYDIMKKTVLYIENEVVESSALDITKDTESRKLMYRQRKENRGMLGIETGIKELDYMLKGLQKKTLITLIASTGVGKAQPLDELVLTPSGYKRMGDIKLNDYVISEDGFPVKVVGVFPQGFKDIYEITFDNGAKVKCCKEHLWKFKNVDMLNRNKDWQVDTLENILSKFKIKRGKNKKSNNLLVPLSREVSFKNQSELPLDPYFLGVLLGDGHFGETNIELINNEEDVIDKCISKKPSYVEFKRHKTTKYRYNLTSNIQGRENELKIELNKLGLDKVLSRDKFIPNIYKLSSIKDRRELLKGLFDTDGHISEKGSYYFFTTSERMKEDFKFLCGSLGYKFSVIEDKRPEKYTNGVCYRIAIKTKDKIFSSNKHEKRYDKYVKVGNREYDNSISYITNVEKIGKEECQCIMVDSKNRTYVTRDFIVTHNTWLHVLVGANAQLNGYRVLQLVTEMSEEQMRDRYDALLTAKTLGKPFNYERFKSGTLTPQEENLYFTYLDKRLPRLEPLIIDSVAGVSNVAAKIDQYRPDIVLIDSAYLMEDDRGADQDWLRVAHITRDLKNLAKNRKIPIFINSQADSTTSKKTGPELENIGYSRAIGQDSDVVLALFRDEQMFEDREMKIKVLKQREGRTGNIIMNWDLDTMNFSSIYSNNSNTNANSGNSNIDKESVEKKIIKL